MSENNSAGLSPHSILVTGGCGFIGSALIRHLIEETEAFVTNVDKLTYAGHPSTVAPVADSPRYTFAQVDVNDRAALETVFAECSPDAVIHLAAESHVDRSIDGPTPFIETNILGTYTLLEVARTYWNGLSHSKKRDFRFLHVSTDEVFGTLGAEGAFTETTPYDPSSPYSASKASADHLVRAWHHTYGLPVLLTNCSNNYGPYQFPEKLIPVVIQKGLAQEPIPVYGSGENVRDWLYVDDHVHGLLTVLKRGATGESYNIGGRTERQNIAVVEQVCSILDELAPDAPSGGHQSLITFVTDRPGHDWRYAIDPSKIETELNWRAAHSFEEGLRETIRWYLDHQHWCEKVLEDRNGLERLGTAA